MSPRFIYGTYQQSCFIHRWPGLVSERITLFAVCSNTCLDICHWLLLSSFGRGVEGEQDLIFCLQNLKYNMWLWIFLLANPEGLNPCSELSFGFGGCTGAAVPVFLHGCPMAPCFPVSAGHYSAFAHGCSPGVCSWWLSPILSLFHPQQPDDYAMIKLINHTIWFWRYYGFYLEVASRSPFWPKSTCSPTFPWCWWHPAPLDIFSLIKLSPACAMHESAWDHSETKGVLSSPLWFCIICSAVSGAAFDFPLPVSASYTAGDRLLDYLELWSDPLHFDQTCCYI